jgi:DNA replication and repair protein RecF
VRIERLNLVGFRSYPTLEVRFPAGPQLVMGRNAAGKTNLLEALVVLALGHSHRTSTDLEMIGWDAPFARLEAHVGSGGQGTDELELVLARPGPATVRKRVKVNGVPRRASALSASLRAVVFAPEDMLLVAGSPSLRRLLLDTLVAQQVTEGSTTLSTYARALQQRNTLLRRIREGGASVDELGYWNDVVAQQGGRIVTWRLAALEAMAQPLAEAHAEIAPVESSLTLRYETNAPLGAGESAEDALRRRLA